MDLTKARPSTNIEDRRHPFGNVDAGSSFRSMMFEDPEWDAILWDMLGGGQINSTPPKSMMPDIEHIIQMGQEYGVSPAEIIKMILRGDMSEYPELHQEYYNPPMGGR